ncbi:hypothetical protein OIU84_006033 [Salix udensis]|uniref:Uncharacterized protein n=1 Tax=Salix udensis TaxID=889485 RepID=A0AAD6JZT9_9ROSI|nr:hypothetical protein OIU84_006033 [Salix udensis]
MNSNPFHRTKTLIQLLLSTHVSFQIICHCCRGRGRVDVSKLCVSRLLLRFNPFSSSPSQKQQQADQTESPKSDAKAEHEDPKGRVLTRRLWREGLKLFEKLIALHTLNRFLIV